VSSERDGTEIKYVGIRSNLGGTARVVNPWGTQAVQARRVDGAGGAGGVVVTASSGRIRRADDGERDLRHPERRLAKPLSSYAYAQITGTGESAAKARRGRPARWECEVGRRAGFDPG